VVDAGDAVDKEIKETAEVEVSADLLVLLDCPVLTDRTERMANKGLPDRMVHKDLPDRMEKTERMEHKVLLENSEGTAQKGLPEKTERMAHKDLPEKTAHKDLKDH
jgi:hypothetical protein